MNADLFSTFDYGFGVIFISESVVLWVSSVICMFYLMNGGTFWFSGSRFSHTYANVSSSVANNIRPYQVGTYGGGVCFVLALLTIFVTMNMFGMGPYIFSVSCHFAFAMSFSFCLWFSMVLFNLKTNAAVYFGFFVLPDLPVVGSMVMVWIEILSNLIRALTLSLRLCLNLASGQIIMGLLGSFANVIFVGSSMGSGFMCGLGCGVLLVMDLFIAGLQAFLFVALVVMYLDENMTC